MPQKPDYACGNVDAAFCCYYWQVFTIKYSARRNANRSPLPRRIRGRRTRPNQSLEQGERLSAASFSRSNKQHWKTCAAHSSCFCLQPEGTSFIQSSLLVLLAVLPTSTRCRNSTPRQGSDIPLTLATRLRAKGNGNGGGERGRKRPRQSQYPTKKDDTHSSREKEEAVGMPPDQVNSKHGGSPSPPPLLSLSPFKCKTPAAAEKAESCYLIQYSWWWYYMVPRLHSEESVARTGHASTNDDACGCSNAVNAKPHV